MKMNTIKSIALSLFMAFVVMSCSEREVELCQRENSVLRISMPECFQSKVSIGEFDDNTVSQVWNEGDCIAVVEGRGTDSMRYSVYRLIGEGGSAEAEFEYVSGNADINGEVDVVYPVSAAASYNLVPHFQEYVSGGYDPSSVVLSWHGENGISPEEVISLENESSVLCLRYTGNENQTVSSVRVRINRTEGTNETYLVKTKGGISLSSIPTQFYVSVPQIAEASEVVFEITLTDQSMMRIVSQDRTFSSGVLYRFPPVPFEANVDPEEGYDVYVCIGQSNMAGRGEILPEDSGVKEGIYLLDGNGDVVPATIPFNIYSTIRKARSSQRFGLHNVFADEVYSYTGKRILMVVNARGSSRLPNWLKGAEALTFGEADDEELQGQNIPVFYDEVIRRTLQAMEYGTLKGILWHQGEADANSSSAAVYVERLQGLVSDIRTELGVDENVPFVMGQVSPVYNGAPIINPQLINAAQAIPNAFCVSSEDCETQDDNVHFSRAGYITLGKRYSKVILDEVYGIKVD